MALVVTGLSSPWQQCGDAACAGHPQLPLVSILTFPLILVIPNPISTDLIFTSKSRMNMLNIIIQ